MLNIVAIDHVVLRVSRLSVMLDFYIGVLGCRLEREREDLGLYQLRAGAALIDLITVDGPLGRQGGAAPGTEGRNLDHFCLRIENFDAEAITHYLSGKSVTPGAVDTRYGAEGPGPSLYISDPEGNVIELKGSSSV